MPIDALGNCQKSGIRYGWQYDDRPFAAGLPAVMRELLFGQPSFEKRARVHAGRRVRLEIDEIAALTRAEEMVEADFEEIGDRRVGRDVAAELRIVAVRAHHHRERVPAHDRGEALLDLEVARILRLLRERDRVAVRRIEHRRQRHARARARSRSLRRRKVARSRPSLSTIASNASSHSLVSVGSASCWRTRQKGRSTACKEGVG